MNIQHKSNKSMEYLDVRRIVSQRSSASSYTINLSVHILRDNNGIFGPTVSEVMAELERMQSRFAPHNICFALLGIDEIWNSSYVENWVVDHSTIGPEIISIYGSSDRMDIIYVPTEIINYSDGVDFGGGSFAIPNHYFAINESYFGLYATSHEMGHCLDLLHTHSHYDSYNSGDITDICDPNLERVDGSNGQTAGDKCPDTNADPVLWFDEVNNDPLGCYGIGPDVDCNSQNFDPPIDNIMSYGRYCQFQFSQDQVDRMHAELTGGSIGSNLIAPISVQLQNTVVSSGYIFITSGTYINHNLGVVYQLSGTVITKHIASNHITLHPGFWADPSATGRYEAYISPLCN